MSRMPSVAFRVAAAAIVLCSGVSRMQAQGPPKPPPSDDVEEDENPFAPQPAPSLPPGCGFRGKSPCAGRRRGMTRPGKE